MSGHRVTPTSIPGLLHVDIPVHGDSRGWFKESYQQDKLRQQKLPDFTVVQNNVSYNESVGVTRGIHAEPWDKYISPAAGRVFAAIVDLRDGDGFGRLQTFTLTVEQALFVPRGCGNSFCTLEPHTVYSYLVNGLWQPGLQYPAVDLFDETLAIEWPLGRDQMIVSDKDLANPTLTAIEPLQVRP